VFAVAEDYKTWLSDHRELKELFDAKFHAYCLMNSHGQLLVALGASASGLEQLRK
jgi:hypothetical protein